MSLSYSRMAAWTACCFCSTMRMNLLKLRFMSSSSSLTGLAGTWLMVVLVVAAVERSGAAFF